MFHYWARDQSLLSERLGVCLRASELSRPPLKALIGSLPKNEVLKANEEANNLKEIIVR